MNRKTKMRDEMFKYKMGHKGLKQFTLEELDNIALKKWRKRVKHNG